MTEQTIPLLKELRVESGTVYTFNSSMQDLILLFSNSNIKMSFSKFACLKLPDWQNVTTQRIYRESNDIKSVNDAPANEDANVFFPKAYFQNYMENFMSYVDDVRTDIDFSNFTEAAFWKALQSVSDGDFDLSTTDDNTIQFDNDITFIDADGTTRQKFKEKTSSDTYEPVIKFVGDVNLHNHKKANGNEYLEVFAHIANSQGRIDGTLLRPNENLTGQVNVSQVPTSPGPDYIVGRETEYNTSDAVDKTYAKAIYDTTSKQYNITGDRDFLQIDWEDLASEDSNDKKNQGNFDFNAVLLYYDIQEDGDDSSMRRNLYGILVLDDMTSVSSVTERIVSQKKYQPNENQAGNAVSFLFNLMFSNNTNQITSTITINDTSLVAMQLYQEALGKLQDVMSKYEGFEKIMLGMQNRVNTLQAQMLGVQNRLITDDVIKEIQKKVNDNTTSISELQ